MMTRTFSLVMLALALAGCATTRQPTRSTVPVCDALVGPIRYNSKQLNSRRHAGPALAQDLAVRNRVGRNLRCPQYR